MTEAEKYILKEHLLTQFYNFADLSPTREELDASRVAFSDELIEKFNEWAKTQLSMMK